MKKFVNNVRLDLGMIFNKIFAIHASLIALHASSRKATPLTNAPNAKSATTSANSPALNAHKVATLALLMLAIFAIMDSIFIMGSVPSVLLSAKHVKQGTMALSCVKRAPLAPF